MAEPYPQTDIHLVPDLRTALEVAQELEAEAIGLDMEGVLGNYVGNDPYGSNFEDFMQGQGGANMSHARAVILDRSEVAFGVITNNRNETGVGADTRGLVTRVADILEIPFVHKGMHVRDKPLKGKPSGELSRRFCELAGVRPEHAVLIDDQGVKNTGDAVRAGLKAMIVPDPIGLPLRIGFPHGRYSRAREHLGVQLGRNFEPLIYASLERQGWLAQIAYSRLAGIDPNLIGELHDHRGA